MMKKKNIYNCNNNLVIYIYTLTDRHEFGRKIPSFSQKLLIVGYSSLKKKVSEGLCTERGQ